MSLSNNFSNTFPSLLLDFVNNEKLDSRVTFTRASTATFFNSFGVLTTADIDVPRFDTNPTTLACNGLLIEEQRTNLLLRSAEFDNASWAKTRATVTANAATAPDGTATADAIVEDGTAANTHDVRQGSISNTATTTWSLSFFIKAVNRTWALIELQNATATSSRARAWFNLQTGVVGTGNTAGSGFTYVSHSIQNVGNGWYRCVLVGTADVAVTTLQAWAEGTTGDNVTGYDGVNGQTSVYIWGAQLEAGAFPTSYIPTTTTALTRNADAASMTGTNFSSWYNATEGTLYYEGMVQVNNDGIVYTGIGDTFDNTAYFVRTAPNQTWAVRSGASAQATVDVVFTPTANVPFKMVGTLKVNDFAFCVNGGTVATDVSGAVPASAVRLGIGNSPWAASGGNARQQWIRSIRYYPVRATNAQLQALTL